MKTNHITEENVGFSSIKPLEDGTSDFSKLRHDLRETIKETLIHDNLSIMPPCNDGSKKPYVSKWKPFQEEKATRDQLVEWYEEGLTGFGLVCGAVSGNLECLDFDDYQI